METLNSATVPVQSAAEILARLPIRKVKELVGDEVFRDYIDTLSVDELDRLMYDWESWARPEQLEPPGSWSIWLYLAGRGSGKTRTGAEWIKSRVKRGKGRHIALISQSAADARDVMVEGEAGILAIYSDRDPNRPKYEPSKRRIVWPNGAQATIYTAEDPDQLRGPSHDTAWTDEIAAFRNVPDVWSNLMLGLRLGDSRCFISTTPRAIKFIKDLVAPGRTDVVISHGRTRDNFENLSTPFLNEIITKYEGTRLGRQELEAEILEDIEGALWSRSILDRNRVKEAPKEMVKIIVSIDPTVATAENATETGIIVMGKTADNHGYCLADRSLTASPLGWAKAGVQAYHDFSANKIVAEKNNGGEMVNLTIQTMAEKNRTTIVPVTLVWASRGKLIRAEPVAALDEQKKLHMVGSFPKLEDELCTYEGEGNSPNRLDAYVWAATELLVDRKFSRGLTWGRGNE